uniref:Uncharacterized protein n=1 Tax=Anguilla anguilla TaxID=7936 RepID=A0A0E9RCA2_ANGAN
MTVGGTIRADVLCEALHPQDD